MTISLDLRTFVVTLWLEAWISQECFLAISISAGEL